MRLGRRWGAVVVAAVLLAAAAPARAEPIFDYVRAFPMHWGGAWPTSEEMTREGAFSVYAWVRDGYPTRTEPALAPAPYAEAYAVGEKHLRLAPGQYLLAYWVDVAADATASNDAAATVTVSIGVDCADLRCAQLVPGTVVVDHEGRHTNADLDAIVVTTVVRVQEPGLYTVMFTAKAAATGGYQAGDPKIGPAVSLWRGGTAEARATGKVTDFWMTPLNAPSG